MGEWNKHDSYEGADALLLNCERGVRLQSIYPNKVVAIMIGIPRHVGWMVVPVRPVR